MGVQVLMSLPPARLAGALLGGSRGDGVDALLVDRLQASWQCCMRCSRLCSVQVAAQPALC